MKLVVDTNIVISAIIRDATTRKLLFHPALELYAPEYIFEELERNKAEVIQKAGISLSEFETFLRVVSKVVNIVPKEAYSEYLEEAHQVIDYVPDEPFAAVAIALGDCGIWSNDGHFIDKESELLQKFGIIVWTVKSLHEIMRK
ncbi:MAG: PIN domain-containing protein [Candidatus Micrarchaeota archaeon]